MASKRKISKNVSALKLLKDEVLKRVTLCQFDLNFLSLSRQINRLDYPSRPHLEQEHVFVGSECSNPKLHMLSTTSTASKGNKTNNSVSHLFVSDVSQLSPSEGCCGEQEEAGHTGCPWRWKHMSSENTLCM